MSATAALLAAAALAAPLACVWIGEQRRVGRERGRLLDGCLGLLDAPALTRDGLDYPVLRGRRDGLRVELRPLADNAAPRKLPSLWLQVTVVAPTGAPGAIDALLRPLGTEHWSPHADLPLDVATPPDLPAPARVRADEGGLALLPLLRAPAAAGFLHRAAAKEVLVTPRGVRLVVQLAEGERGAYLLFRDSRFAVGELPAAEVAALLDQAAALHAAARRRPAARGRLDAAA